MGLLPSSPQLVLASVERASWYLGVLRTALPASRQPGMVEKGGQVLQTRLALDFLQLLLIRPNQLLKMAQHYGELR